MHIDKLCPYYYERPIAIYKFKFSTGKLSALSTDKLSSFSSNRLSSFASDKLSSSSSEKLSSFSPDTSSLFLSDILSTISPDKLCSFSSSPKTLLKTTVAFTSLDTCSAFFCSFTLIVLASPGNVQKYTGPNSSSAISMFSELNCFPPLTQKQ